jgi:sugar/nucleoside kinase (ribokinase family)
VIHVAAATPLQPGEQVVDTVGAGDTFIGSVIAHLIFKNPLEMFDTIRAMRSALDLCAKKVVREGFGGLVEME